MADTNETFSPLDSLGPAYGKINQPSLDVQGLSAFEGESLRDPAINFPDRPTNFVPIVPSAGQLDNQQTTVRKDIVGKPGAKANPNRLGAKDFAKAIGDFYSARAATDQDKNEYARIYSYDATPDGGAFYKRYAAAGEETFNKLGFHPFRDNEAIYNAGTSGWADAKRMMVHSFWPMFTHAFKSAPKSLGKMLQGDFSPDKEGAMLSAEQSAIGYSSRGGVGAWLNNTGMSFAYTAGVIVEALAEEVVLAGVTAATGGGASPALFAATANNARKIPSLLKGLNTADNAIDGMKAMNATLNGMKSVSGARSFWNAARVEKTLSSNTAKFFNPLSNLTEAGIKIAKNEDNLTGLARAYDATKKTFGGFYGDIRAVNMALSEARLEGGMAENDTYNGLYDDYYRVNKEAPDNKLQEKMMLQAKEAGMTDLIWNTALIYGSNKLVLPNIVNRRGGVANFLKSKTEELLNLEGGDILKTTSKTTLKTGRKVATPKLEWRERNLWNTVKGFAERPLSKSIPAGISYFKANIGEALQENLQEVISDATKNYYIDSFSNPAVATHQYARGLVKNAVKDQFSARGFETFASGFVMGMFASPLNAVPKAFSIGYNKIFDNEAYTKYKMARSKYGQQMVNTLSSVDLKDFFDNNLRNYGVQASVADIKMTASEKVARDASDAAFISQMQTVLEKGMMDYYVDNLKSLQQLTAEEFEEMVPSIPAGKGQEYLDRIPETIERAQKMEKKFNDINERFPNPVNINNYKKGDPEYEDASLTYHAWEEAKRNAIFFNESFEDTTKRMSSIINDVTSSGLLKKASFNDMKVLFDQALLKNESEILQTEIDTLTSTKGDAREISKKKRKLKALQDLEEGMTEFKRYYVDRNDLVQRIISDNKDVSEEELLRMIDDELGIRNDENDLQYNNKLDETFRNYLKELASVNDDTLFDSDVDSAFEKLRDFYLLSKEAQGMVRGINLLHDPKGFVEHVKRNKVWMKELYDNRREYYENLKEQEFQNKEGNDILNHLASRGLYISLDDYERWRTMKILPDEIYDDIHKVVIRKSHPEYDEIVRPFLMLNDLQTVKNEMQIVEESVREDLDQLDAELQRRLDELPKTETKKDLGSLDFKGKETIKLKQISEQLGDKEYVDALAKDGTPLVFYKDGDVLRVNDADGEEATDSYLSELGTTNAFSEATKYAMVSEADPDAVKEVMDEFAEKKAELIQKASEKGVENPGEVKERVVYTTDMDITDFPPELHNRIVVAFEDYAEENGLTDLVGDDYDMALDSFLKSSLEADRIVNDYNKEQELGQTMVREPEVPMIKIGDKTMKITEIPEAQLRSLLKTYKTELDSLSEQEQTPEIKQRIARLNYGIRKINDYLAGKVKEGFSEAQRKTLDLLQPIIDFQNDITKGKGGYLINNQIMKRVTQVIRQFETEEYKYQKEADVKATFNTTIAEQGFNETSIKNFITELRKQKLPGFSEFTYNELQSELNSLLYEGGVVPVSVKGVEIFNPSVGQVKREGGVVFGAAGKMNQSPERINQDALFVDQEKGLFIVADGMGGVNKVPFFQPHHAAKLMIEHFRGIKGKTPVDLIQRLYEENNNVSDREIFERLKQEGYIDNNELYNSDGQAAVAIRAYLKVFSNQKDFRIFDNSAWVTRAVGAVGVKAQRIGTNKYEIEHVGDAVFFIVDKNNKVRKAEGLSTSPFVDGFLWGVSADNKAGVTPASKINKYQVELKPGERLVLSSDFIETKEAIQDFINSNFGENLNFDSFRKNNKNDDASFIVIEYGAESKVSEAKTTAPQISNEELLNKVMNTIAEKTYEESRVSGNYVDDQVRDLFADKEPKFDDTKITREAFDNLFNEDPENPGYLRNIKRMVDQEGLYVLSRVVLNDGTERGLVLYDEDAGVAGEVDLLAVDRLGNVYIIDTKTGKEVKWRGFNVEGNQSSKKEIYTLQQTAYANLLYNLIDKQAKVSLLPIQIDYEAETGKITRAGKPTAKGALEEGKYRIPLEITPEIQEKIDSVIPRKIKAAPPVEETGPVENQDFSDEREPEDISTPEPTQERVQDLDIEVLRKPIAEATQETLDKINSRLAELVAQNKFTVESISQVQELINERQRQLDSGVDVQLTADNINSGDQLVALTPIFVNNKTAVVEGEVVIIKSVEKTAGFVSVNTSITPTLELTFSFAELNKMFKLKEEVMKTKGEDTGTAPLTKDEKDFIDDSFINVNQLLKNSPRKDDLKKEADKQLTDDVDTELFEDVTSDC